MTFSRQGMTRPADHREPVRSAAGTSSSARRSSGSTSGRGAGRTSITASARRGVVSPSWRWRSTARARSGSSGGTASTRWSRSSHSTQPAFSRSGGSRSRSRARCGHEGSTAAGRARAAGDGARQVARPRRGGQAVVDRVTRFGEPRGLRHLPLRPGYDSRLGRQLSEVEAPATAPRPRHDALPGECRGRRAPTTG